MTTTTYTPCANCGLRNGTQEWVGEGGALAWTHGFYAMWCDLCVAEAQLAYAKEQAAEIPALKEKVAALQSKEGAS